MKNSFPHFISRRAFVNGRIIQTNNGFEDLQLLGQFELNIILHGKMNEKSGLVINLIDVQSKITSLTKKFDTGFIVNWSTPIKKLSQRDIFINLGNDIYCYFKNEFNEILYSISIKYNEDEWIKIGETNLVTL